ncbi:MAG: SpoVG family protein [Christensenellaceae bacterium]|jgi:stage V sporulation protein G|nr:SpoVG family protein [Christensenellaceae bacterium]
MSNTETGVKLDVRAYPIAEPKGSVVAFASVTIDDMFAVNNIRVVNSDKGPFVAMPQVKDKEGQYRDICFPVTSELCKQMNEAILGAYAAEKEKAAPAKESTTEKLREGAKEAKAQPAKTGEKAAPKKSDPEL